MGSATSPTLTPYYSMSLYKIKLYELLSLSPHFMGRWRGSRSTWGAFSGHFSSFWSSSSLQKNDDFQVDTWILISHQWTSVSTHMHSEGIRRLSEVLRHRFWIIWNWSKMTVKVDQWQELFGNFKPMNLQFEHTKRRLVTVARGEKSRIVDSTVQFWADSKKDAKKINLSFSVWVAN